jgi:hypothetical protein
MIVKMKMRMAHLMKGKDVSSMKRIICEPLAFWKTTPQLRAALLWLGKDDTL